MNFFYICHHFSHFFKKREFASEIALLNLEIDTCFVQKRRKRVSRHCDIYTVIVDTNRGPPSHPWTTNDCLVLKTSGYTHLQQINEQEVLCMIAHLSKELRWSEFQIEHKLVTFTVRF